MYEKISEKDKRIEKVKKVKDKILAEIDTQLEEYKNVISEQGIPNDSYEFCIKESFALFVLRDFLNKPYCFMMCAREYKEKDIILYIVSDEDLSIWLQDNYSFVTNYLIKAEEADYCIFPFMSDNYFGHYFTNPFDVIIYKEKRHKELKQRLEGKFDTF